MENYVNQLPKATPFIIACEKGTMHDVTNYVNSVENVEVLLNLKGSLSTGQMDLGNGECIDVTGLEAAVIFNQFDVVEYLLQYKPKDIGNSVSFALLGALDNRVLNLLFSYLNENIIMLDINIVVTNCFDTSYFLLLKNNLSMNVEDKMEVHHCLQSLELLNSNSDPNYDVTQPMDPTLYTF